MPKQEKKQQDILVKALQQISKTIAEPMNLGDVLGGILNWVITLMDKVNFCAVNLLDERREKLVVMAERGSMKVKPEYRETRIGVGIVGWVALHGISQMLQNVKKDPRYLNALDGPEAGSEIAVPMLIGKQLIGVLNIEHPDVDAFREVDLALAEGIAGLAAIAIENSKLHIDMDTKVNERTRELEKANEKNAVAAESLLLMTKMSSEFVHKMNNLAGTIPVRVKMAMAHLDTSNPAHHPIAKELAAIENDSRFLLKSAAVIRRNTGAAPPEYLDPNAVLEDILSRMIANTPGILNRLTVVRNFSPGLPRLRVERSGLYDAVESIIKNGIEAVEGNGVLEISSGTVRRRRETFLDISVSDTGRGIPPDVLPKIFDLFFTTKETGLGFGLWRDRAFVRRIGGDITVESREGHGSVFHLEIPVDEKNVEDKHEPTHE